MKKKTKQKAFNKKQFIITLEHETKDTFAITSN